MESAQPFDHGAWVANERAIRRRPVIWIALVIAALLALFYVGRVAWLSVMATEGDVPRASSIPLPGGAEIMGDSIGCGSGGCSVTFTVRPPAGLTPEALAEEMGATPQMSVRGTL